MRRISKNVSWEERRAANKEKAKGASQQRPTTREEKGEQKKKGKPQQRREQGHRNHTKKREPNLEAVRGAGFPSFPLSKKTLL